MTADASDIVASQCRCDCGVCGCGTAEWVDQTWREEIECCIQNGGLHIYLEIFPLVDDDSSNSESVATSAFSPVQPARKMGSNLLTYKKLEARNLMFELKLSTAVLTISAIRLFLRSVTEWRINLYQFRLLTSLRSLGFMARSWHHSAVKVAIFTIRNTARLISANLCLMRWMSKIRLTPLSLSPNQPFLAPFNLANLLLSGVKSLLLIWYDNQFDFAVNCRSSSSSLPEDHHEWIMRVDPDRMNTTCDHLLKSGLDPLLVIPSGPRSVAKVSYIESPDDSPSADRLTSDAVADWQWFATMTWVEAWLTAAPYLIPLDRVQRSKYQFLLQITRQAFWHNIVYRFSCRINLLQTLSTSLVLFESSNPFSVLFEIDAIADEIFPRIAFLFQNIPTENELSRLPSTELNYMALGDYGTMHIAPLDELRRWWVNMIRCDHLQQSRMSLAMITSRVCGVCKSWNSAFTTSLLPQPMIRRLLHLLRIGSRYFLPPYDLIVQESNTVLRKLLNRWLLSTVQASRVPCATFTKQIRSQLLLSVGNMANYLFLVPTIHLEHISAGRSAVLRIDFPNWRDHIPVKNHHKSDIQICSLDQFGFDSVCLDIQSEFCVCTKSPITARFVENALHRRRSAAKMGSNASDFGVLPSHPTIGNKRAVLGPCSVDHEAAETLFETAAFGSAIAKSTETKYSASIREFFEYTNSHEIDFDYTKDSTTLVGNIRHWLRRFLLSEGGVRGLSYSAIRNKAYGVRWHFLIQLDIDILEGWANHRVFMRGVKRLRHHPQRKVPLSRALLLLIISDLDLNNDRQLVIATGLVFGWFFGTRISELLSMRLCMIRLYDANSELLDFSHPDLAMLAVEIDVHFGVTKNDQEGEGAVRSHYMTGQLLCVVKLISRMLSRRALILDLSNAQDALFRFFDASSTSQSEQLLSREVIVRVLKAGAAAANIPAARVSSHSMRSGAAVAMLRAGCSYEDTRCFFRWRSDVARIYLRAVRGAMRSISCLMANGTGMNRVRLVGN